MTERKTARSAKSGEFVTGDEAAAHPAETVVETVEPKPVKPKPVELFDLVGEDGRRIVRNVTYAAAAEERGRVGATNPDEKLEIVPVSSAASAETQ